jgi:hypothetical protein
MEELKLEMLKRLEYLKEKTSNDKNILKPLQRKDVIKLHKNVFKGKIRMYNGKISKFKGDDNETN